MKKFYALFFCLILMLSCSEEEQTPAHLNGREKLNPAKHDHFLIGQGQWIGQLGIKKNKKIPFNFEVIQDSVFIINSEERIGAKINHYGDSILIKIPVFDSEFHFAKTTSGLAGYWYNNAKTNYKLPFTARLNKAGIKNRFDVSQNNNYSIYDGEWETTFSQGSGEEYKAIAAFNQDKQSVAGTFITQTGDYRFLQGNISNDSIMLSCFDGSHAFLFEGRLFNGIINGWFYSGSHWSEPWASSKNELFTLANPYSLTNQVKEEKLEFTFPGIDGKNVSYPNRRYDDKVVIIQVLGSWCPNCVDETKFFTALHNQYQHRGLEIIGLAFEVPEKLSDKIARVKDLKSHFGAKYEFLIAGGASKKEAQKALPVLSEVSSFPTTIFIGKKGVIRKIHTGFYGPGTGDYYTKYVSEVNALVESLLSE
jgi:thiol-disulfide isomerase/thioredoxin